MKALTLRQHFGKFDELCYVYNGKRNLVGDLK